MGGVLWEVLQQFDTVYWENNDSIDWWTTKLAVDRPSLPSSERRACLTRNRIIDDTLLSTDRGPNEDTMTTGRRILTFRSIVGFLATLMMNFAKANENRSAALPTLVSPPIGGITSALGHESLSTARNASQLWNMLLGACVYYSARA